MDSIPIVLFAKGGLSAVIYVEKSVLVLLFLVDSAHECCVGRYGIAAEEEECFLGSEFDALANDVMELSDGEVAGNEIFLLVDLGHFGAVGLFADDGNAIGILGSDALGF